MSLGNACNPCDSIYKVVLRLASREARAQCTMVQEVAAGARDSTPVSAPTNARSLDQAGLATHSKISPRLQTVHP